MKVLTLHQPFATLVGLGQKLIETRGQAAPRSVIGQRIAIHAAAKVPTVGFYPHGRILYARTAGPGYGDSERQRAWQAHG
ncbi:MAG TPA: hypothetical protein PLV68_09920, partial [Ilumatobacteraceae bacterium]|nr:hypothetical protein [Ilumatobacteraceae bacterium]